MRGSFLLPMNEIAEKYPDLPPLTEDDDDGWKEEDGTRRDMVRHGARRRIGVLPLAEGDGWKVQREAMRDILAFPLGEGGRMLERGAAHDFSGREMTTTTTCSV